MANQSLTLKAAGLQTYYQSLMETPPGSLLKANNTIINREGVIESRRGIKAYNNSDNLLPAKTKQMFEYKGRILSHLQNNMLVYDNGSAVFIPFSGTYQEPVSGYRMRSAESKGNFYFTTNTGVKRISAKTAADLPAVDAIQQAGVPKGIAGYTKVDYNISGFLSNGYKAGYIVIWTYTDKQGTPMQGAPSAPMIAENKSIVTDNSAVQINFQIPYGITLDNYNSYKFTLYRSENVTSASTVPNEYRQIYQRSPSFAEVDSLTREISYVDSISESLRIGGIPAYTNSASGFGLLQGNEPPPYARDISLFSGSMFYANTRTSHSATVNLLSTTGFSSGISNLIISNGATTNTYEFQGQKQTTEFTIGTIGASLANIQNGDYFLLNSAGNERKYTVWFDKTTNGAVAQQSTVTVSTTLPVASSYFTIYSGLNQRQYVVWFDRTGTNIQPTVPGTYGYIRINTGAAPTNITIANAIYTQMVANASSDFTLAYTAGSAVVTIVNKLSGPTTDITRSTVPASNLTVATTVQGTGPLPGTIPLRVYLNPTTVTTSALVASAIETAIRTSLSFDFTTSYSGSNTFTVTAENNGFADDSSLVMQNTQTSEVSTVTVTATLPTASSYFIINSANNTRQYVIWFDRTGTNTQPTVTGTYGYIRINTGATPTAISIAGLINTAINANASLDFTSTNPGTAVVTITNKGGPSTDISQSTSPAANLTLAVTTQGSNWINISTIQSGVGEDLANKKILISGKLDLVAALEDMARSIVRVINYNSSEIVTAYYASSAGTTPGKIIIQAKTLEDINFFVGTTDSYITSKFSPELGLSIQNTSAVSDSDPLTLPLCSIDTVTSHNLLSGDTVLIYDATSTITSTAPSLNGKKIVSYINSTRYTIPQDVNTVTNAGYTMTAKMMSTADAIGNRVYYSKYQEPEAVPILNYQDVGSKDQEILRIIPLRDGLYIFKNDGIFRLTGADGNFQIGVYDNTAILKAPDTVVTLGNMCYFYGNQGIVKMGDAGMESISRPIEDKVIPFLKSNPNLSTAAFAVAYESDRALLLWTVKSKLDTVATVCLRYNTYTQTWTEWEVPKLCAVLNSHEDTMYFGSAVDNYIEVERKNFDRFDYADRELAATMGDGALIGDSLYLVSSTFALLSVGDVFSQTQYVSIPQFNSLLKKLDLDPGVLATNFYSDIKLEVGGDLNARMVELITKLNTVDTWTGTDTNGNTSYVFVPNYIDYSNVQVQFNKIVDRLNQSPNALHDNYLYSEGTKVYECYITDLEVNTKKISLNIAPAFMVGPLKIYKGIPVEIQYSPQHGGDSESFKQFSDASFLFERRSFYSGQVAFNSDISDNFEEIPLFPNSSGVFGGATWGDGSTWGGLGDQANMRSYIPLKKQRCRFLGCKFIHVVALENFQLYGVSLSYRTYSINNRDYR